MSAYETVIGLEVHVHLCTKSKLFCSCPTTFGVEPNTNVCEVCAGMPGVLPVLNQTAVEYATRAGLALDCTINNDSVFARKNYFYPDMPYNYQISQFERIRASGHQRRRRDQAHRHYPHPHGNRRGQKHPRRRP